MTPLQPSGGGAASSGGVLDAEWDGRLAAASWRRRRPRRRLGRASSGVFQAPTGTGVFPGARLQSDNEETPPNHRSAAATVNRVSSRIIFCPTRSLTLSRKV